MRRTESVGNPAEAGERELALAALPSTQTRRWVARRKADVVAAVRSGLLTFEDACRRYNLSAEEFTAWEQAIDRHGLSALRVTRLQTFRRRQEHEPLSG